jgi:hypothetical protein
VGLKLNAKHRLLADAEIVNILRDIRNIATIKKNTQTLIYASGKVGLEIEVEKSKYALLARHMNVSVSGHKDRKPII